MANASVEFLSLPHKPYSNFDAAAVWQRLMDRSVTQRPVTVFMAVPTMYSRLFNHWKTFDPVSRQLATRSVQSHPAHANLGTEGGMRLMVSGSSALPESLFRAWREEVCGGGGVENALLERYGMTEIGMGLHLFRQINTTKLCPILWTAEFLDTWVNHFPMSR